MSPGAPWWKHAVCYQVYVRSFADSGGDGIGDLPGITSRLGYLRDLGVDALWITPFYTSPQHDHGYDVADYRAVDPLFGSLEDADTLLATAHELGLRVIVDLVPNHTSSEHAWFRAALAAGPGSPERARYLFRPGRGADGAEPPNNWRSVFGGPAWTRVPDGEWYLHLFDTSQPDLDWRHPEVGDLFADVLGFWLDRGVDGFRIDVAHGLVKEQSLRDQVVVEPAGAGQPMIARELADEPMWDQPEVHEVYRRWRRILDSYDGDRMSVAEAWTQTPESMARFVRPDELHQTFNFALLMATWDAGSFAEIIDDTMAALPAGVSPTWVLSNHDVHRHATRYGGGATGLARARAATLAMLMLPGSAYLYQGEELGLEEVDVAPEHWQDPMSLRTGNPGRDGCRVPLPWAGTEPPYGFGPDGSEPWIPQPADWAGLTVAAQQADPSSTLAFYTRALAVRRDLATTAGDEVTARAEAGLLVLERGPLTCVLNAGDAPVALPTCLGGLLLSSGEEPGTTLAPDTAAWFRR